VVSTVTDTLAADYRALTGGCGLVDRAGRGRLALTGPDAKTFLHGQITQDVEGLEPGRGAYAAFLTHKGKMLGDLRVLDLGDELLLSCERVALQELFNMIRRYKLGSDVELHKRTLEMGELSLIGPEARRIAGAGALGPDEHDNVRAEIGGHPVVLVATDGGVDVFCDAERTEGVRGALVASGAVEVSEAAAEVVRVESGRPRYGIELDDSVIPQEAGLNERAVSFTKGCYVGQETVARLFYRGKPNRHLRGLRLSAPVEPGTPLLLGEKQVGKVASSVVSPALGPIALAIVRREASPGDELRAGEASAAGEQSAGEVTAEVVELPFEGYIRS
jgi:folate-binding protein YgfZ